MCEAINMKGGNISTEFMIRRAAKEEGSNEPHRVKERLIDSGYVRVPSIHAIGKILSMRG